MAVFNISFIFRVGAFMAPKPNAQNTVFIALFSAIGQFQTDAGYGIDFWANTDTAYAQINYANTNFVYVDSGTAAIQSPNAIISTFTSGISNTALGLDTRSTVY